MANISAMETPNKWIKILNVLLIVVNFIVAFTIMAIKFSRATYQEISNDIFSPDKSLMDSGILDLLLRKEISIFVVLFLGWIVFKEFKISSIRKCLQLNIITFVGLIAYAAMLLYLIYSPILSAA